MTTCEEFDELLHLTTPLLLYVGPELTQAAGLASTSALIEGLLERADATLPRHQADELRELGRDPELPRHALFTELQRALTPPMFGRTIERMLDDRGKPLPPLARALAQLAPRLRGVLTPNLDHLLERAFEGTLDVHARPHADLPSRSGWLYKLLGTLRDHDTWVFTSEQVGRALHRDPLQRSLFHALFLAHPIVFVGTRLDDPLLREVLDEIASLSRGQPPRHYMFVERSEATPSRRRRLAASGLALIPYDDEPDLLALLGRLAGVESAPPPQPALPRETSTPRTPKPLLSRGGPPLRIVFASANPLGTQPLSLQREEKAIRQAIALSPHHARLELHTLVAASFDDLRRALLHGGYDMLHLSGHAEYEGFLLEDDAGNCVQISPSVLAALCAIHAPPRGALRCVVLNACFSLSSIAPISTSVPHAIGMKGPIADRAAIEFSRGFFDAIAAECDVVRAYREGLICVRGNTPEAKFESVLFVDGEEVEASA